MATQSFQQQVIAFQRKAERAMTATLRESIQDLAGQANESRFKGGRLPIDTGFLRNSLSGAVNSIPRGPGYAPDGYKQTDWDESPVLLAINLAKIGDRFILGWTAKYALAMEARYAYMRSAAQNWDVICEAAARRVERAIR